MVGTLMSFGSGRHRTRVIRVQAVYASTVNSNGVIARLLAAQVTAWMMVQKSCTAAITLTTAFALVFDIGSSYLWEAIY